MQTNQGLTPDQLFFYMHAGYSWDPKVETQDQGRVRCAIRLADAEQAYLQAHKSADASCVWVDDTADPMFDGPFTTCEGCEIRIGNEAIAGLYSILDADADYRREVRAELALECIDRLREVTAGA